MPFPFPSLGRASLMACLAIGTNAAAQTQQPPPAATHAYDYAQPADTLVDALNSIARRTGLVLILDAAALQGLRSTPVTGRHTPEQALRLALQGTGWQLIHDHGEFYSVRPSPTHSNHPVTHFAPIEVSGQLPLDMEPYTVAGSVNVVTRQQIERLPPRNAGDILADVPGVSTSQSRQNPGMAINIRGLQGYGRVNVMIDGARQNFQQSGHGSNGSVYLDPALLAQVDIAKGPSAGVGGAGMIAGSVNFRTLDIGDLVEAGRSTGAQINLGSGSNSYNFSGSAAGGWRLDEHWDVTAAVSKKRMGEFKRGERNVGGPEPTLTGAGVNRQTRQDQTSGLFKLGWKPAATHQLKLGYVGYAADFDEGSFADPSLSGTIESSNRVRNDTLTLLHSWAPDSPWWQLDSSLYYANTRNDSDREGKASMGIAPARMHYETYTLGATVQNQARFMLGGLDARWTLGGEIYRDRTRPGAVTQATGADRQDPKIAVGGTPQGERTVMGTFTELGLSWRDRIELTAGLRYDSFGLRGDGLMHVGRFFNGSGARPPYSDMYTSFSVDKHDSAVLPSLRLAVKPIDTLQLFANYGKGMRPPAITESLRFGKHPGVSFFYYPNPNLDVEKSRSWDVGANLMLNGLLSARDQLGLKLAWFDTKVDNYIVGASIMTPSSTTSGGSTPPYAFVNLLAPFHTRGLELSSDYDAGVAFAAANYTHALINTGESRYDAFPLGSTVGYPPTDYGKGGASPNILYAMPPEKKLVLTGGVRLFDQRLTLGLRMHYEKPSRANTEYIGHANNTRSYHVYDAWASLVMNKNVTLRLSVQNLRDENYYEAMDGTYWIAPGRTATGSVSVSF
ncbi:TonB-dependent hemoglobin/transferrin/lactoferrin family receptor [Kerstersia similis]|uniref:TonB-dependent receptor n=1 Tax=Kerstersia similis TaxID=206505 RepID=UPI0039EE9AE5